MAIWFWWQLFATTSLFYFQINLNWALGFWFCSCFCFSESHLCNWPTWTNFRMGYCGKGFIHHSTWPHGYHTPYPPGTPLLQPKASVVFRFSHSIYLLSCTPEKRLQHKAGVPAGITWLRRLHLNKDQLLSSIKPHFCSISLAQQVS